MVNVAYSTAEWTLGFFDSDKSLVILDYSLYQLPFQDATRRKKRNDKSHVKELRFTKPQEQIFSNETSNHVHLLLANSTKSFWLTCLCLKEDR